MSMSISASTSLAGLRRTILPARRTRALKLGFLVGFLGAAMVVALALIVRPARAEGAAMPVSVIGTPGAPIAPLMLAMQDGIMAAHHLDVKFTLVPLMPSLPPILVSGSGEIGFMTTTTFLQAVDGGLDLVVVAPGGVTAPAIADAAVIARPDVAIEKPADFIGKSVGVPGLGAYYHVIFRWWLMQHGIDPAKLHFVEVAFPSMGDALRGRSVDAVVTLDPFQSQILGAGVGRLAVPIYQDVPGGKPIVMYIATREWATAHKDTVHAFRAALAEAQAAGEKDPEAMRNAFAQYVKMPPAVAAHLVIGGQSSHLDAAGLQWWIDVMNQQKMLTGKIDVSRLIAE